MKTIFLNKTLLLFVAIIFVSLAEIQAQTFPNTGNLVSTRFRVQGNLDAGSSWQRGMVSQNIYFNTSTDKWIVNGGTYNDFAMMKFNNGGHIGIYARPMVNGGNYELTNSQLESYNSLTTVMLVSVHHPELNLMYQEISESVSVLMPILKIQRDILEYDLPMLHTDLL